MMFIDDFQAQYFKAAPISACRDFAEQTNQAHFFNVLLEKNRFPIDQNRVIGAGSSPDGLDLPGRRRNERLALAGQTREVAPPRS